MPKSRLWMEMWIITVRTKLLVVTIRCFSGGIWLQKLPEKLLEVWEEEREGTP